MQHDIIKSIKEGASIFIIAQFYAMKSQFVYRTQAVLNAVNAIISILIMVAFIAIMYSVSQGIQGWSYYQVLLLVGLSQLSIIAVYFANPSRINIELKTGYFDTYLTKPQNPVLMLIARGEGGWFLLFAVTAVGVTAYAISNLAISLITIVPFVILFVGGLTAFLFFTLFVGVASYRAFTQAKSQTWLMGNIADFGQYPLKIYGNIGALLLTFVAPIAVVTFYPASVLLGKIGLIDFFAIFALEVALSLVFLKTSMRLLRGYTSASG